MTFKCKFLVPQERTDLLNMAVLLLVVLVTSHYLFPWVAKDIVFNDILNTPIY